MDLRGPASGSSIIVWRVTGAGHQRDGLHQRRKRCSIRHLADSSPIPHHHLPSLEKKKKRKNVICNNMLLKKGRVNESKKNSENGVIAYTNEKEIKSYSRIYYS
jgi:hypothetical protein